MGFFDRFRRKESGERSSPLRKVIDERYEENPFDRYLDAYVLWVIGELPSHLDQHLQQTTPHLREMFNVEGNTWQEAVAANMEFDPEMADVIRTMWERNRNACHPMDFAMRFVDTNFSEEPDGGG